jgi:hypothetical protein
MDDKSAQQKVLYRWCKNLVACINCILAITQLMSQTLAIMPDDSSGVLAAMAMTTIPFDVTDNWARGYCYFFVDGLLQLLL